MIITISRRDYRNGFGWSGWALDPTRYIILLLRGLGLVNGLKRANRFEEAEIIAARKLARVDQLKSLNKDAAALYAHWENRVMALRQDWLEAVSRWETLRKESKLLQQANVSRKELTQDLRQAKALVKARKEEFFAAVEQLNYRAHRYSR